MQLSALTSENSTIVMIDHAVGFGNVFRSHDPSLHVNNTVGLAKTAGVFGIPLVLTNGADTGPYGPLFSELRAVTGGARVIVREGNFVNAATADGNTLIVDNTVLDKLFTVNPVTGASAPINVASLIPNSMDGLLLEGSCLWVVENTSNTVIRVTISHDLSSGMISSTITSPLFDDPTTAAKYGDELALPNGRYDLGLPPPFGPGAPPGTTFNVVVVPAY